MNKQHKMSPPLNLSFCWNSTLHIPPCCHTLAERLALMWLAAIQVYERNEQMWLFPPITILHLALQPPLYSTLSTFSLHFPFSFPDCNSPQLLKNISRASRENFIMYTVCPVKSLSSDKANTAFCRNMQPNLEEKRTDEQTFYVRHTSPSLQTSFFFQKHMKQILFYQISTLKSQKWKAVKE